MKNLLLIAPVFFEYHEKIIAELENQGYNVFFLSDRPTNNSFLKALLRFSRGRFNFLFDTLFLKSLAGIGAHKFDYLFVVNGECLSSRLISRIKTQFFIPKSILYLWDSVNNKPNSLRISTNFDTVYTFDPFDSEQHSFNFLPLFFVSVPALSNPPLVYDVSFVGTIHSDRYTIINKLKRNLNPDSYIYIYMFVQAKWVFYLKKIFLPGFWMANIREFQFKPLKYSDFVKVFSTSRAIIDIEHPSQRGLTMRTFETIYAQKKLITTNPYIVNYDFYATDRVLVVDRDSEFTIPNDFLTSLPKPLPSAVLEKYSLPAWLRRIMES